MPSKKHLGSEGRRRTNRRRAVQLSEFLRGDDEPTGQLPGSPAQSQHTNGSSIGTIPSRNLTASFITVSPIVTPDTPIPLSPPTPSSPVNAWQLSGKNDPSQGTFKPDNKAFPELGKQGKKLKALSIPETNNAIRSLDSSKARRDCPVLDSFLLESVLPEKADGKGRAVASWLSSIRSAVGNCQDTEPASCSPPSRNTLKTATSQECQGPSCSSQQISRISSHKAVSTAALAVDAMPTSESGLSQQKDQQMQPHSPGSSSENKLQQENPSGSSRANISENPSARETRPVVEFQFGDEDVVPASQFSNQDQNQTRSGTLSFWEKSDDSAQEEQAVEHTGEREIAGGPLTTISPSLLNVNAQEFRPMVRNHEREQEQLYPAGESTHQLRETKLMRRRRAQRTKRTNKRRLLAQITCGQIFENEVSEQGAIQAQQQGEGQHQEGSQMASPVCYYSAPAANQHQERAVTPEQQYHGNQVYPAYVTVPVTSPTTPVYVAAQTTPAPVASTSQIPNIMQNNADASQSDFRMACLPSTGVGTTNLPPTDISSINQLPSSISGASHLTHTLSSLPPVEEDFPDCHRQQSIISPDLLYNRSLLDMDREETQEEEVEEVEQASRHQQWGGWQLNSIRETATERDQPRQEHKRSINIEGDAGVGLSAHKPIFRSPSSHSEGYPQPDLNCVPANIKKLHKTVTRRYSDYAFVYALSGQLGQDCVPMDCYVYLKMILLASIASIEPDELRPPISLCIISTDSLMANRLMNSIGQLAPRFLGPHEYGLQPTISGGQLSTSRYTWVVASPLLLAQQGVYYAGDWTRMSKEQAEQIEKCIENGSVPVPQVQSDQALEAAVWMHWQPKNSTNQTLSFSKLCPIFGMPIYMGDGAGSSSDSLWNFLLRQHTKDSESEDNQPDGLNIPEEDMRMLLHLLHQRQITFQESAQYMLQKYYVISRKERPTVFSSKTYVVLKQFSESFAKLALRLEVLESDVCVAIFHCEHFVQKIFGGTSPPPPAVNNFSIISHIDPYMNEFARWLLQYLDRYEDQELGMHKANRRRTDSWEFL
ncbi:hypothetical protein KR038_007123 [Drosophila bunnanda]|nr:hypothetical protein KR038_007123 [Drosophila bunnanda]